MPNGRLAAAVRHGILTLALLTRFSTAWAQDDKPSLEIYGFAPADAIANLLATPEKNLMMGGEFQWANRENNFDGFSVDDLRLQCSLKYSFSYKTGS